MKIAAVLLLALVTTVAHAQNGVVVTGKCLNCICRANSNSNSCPKIKTCTGTVCGPFGITEGFWEDGGRNTINGEASNSPNAYPDCSKDLECSKRTVRGYMKRYAQDCNKDNKVDCVDFARIHRLGPNGCSGNLTVSFTNILNNCLKQ